ncbi:hypothetical protein [Helicobacter zhangjianzhongii]|uniref:hypothetical protein n=1 Tax=Helicobacter zhangjianzhongii TaxID=2974574 RepID=UPI002556A2BF|nr:hypothetical protein [Helicobacter sp. CPD2-1]MDL0080764.1 hypothetical protein [Helicobacter sp. CPD2-1]
MDSRDNAENIKSLESIFDNNAQKSKKWILGGLGLFHHRFGILGFAMKKQGCAAFCAEIRLVAYRTSKRQAPCFIAQSRIPSKSGF